MHCLSLVATPSGQKREWVGEREEALDQHNVNDKAIYRGNFGLRTSRDVLGDYGLFAFRGRRRRARRVYAHGATLGLAFFPYPAFSRYS